MSTNQTRCHPAPQYLKQRAGSHAVSFVLSLILLVSLAGGRPAQGADGTETNQMQTDSTDPYLWLEDIHGARAMEWVTAQNAKSSAVLKTDPDYQKDFDAILKVLDAADRIPAGELNHQFVFNFWQDAQHPKGIWRRTTIADYTNARPQWETLLDLDKLAADEHENWVWKGAELSPSLQHCLISLSRGGGDAVVVREFDLGTRNFNKEGFARWRKRNPRLPTSTMIRRFVRNRFRPPAR